MADETVNILVVEDEAIVALDLAAGLEKDGYNIVGTADNSQEALELFTQNPVDIVLMDINIIGDVDGIETALRMLTIKQVPIIYLTAYTDAKIIERVKQTHPAAFLTKPYQVNNVRIAIELALNNFAVANTNAMAAKVVSIEKNSATAPADKETVLLLNGYIFIKHNYQFVKLSLIDILYVEADNNYVNIVTLTKKLAVRLSLNQLLEKIHFKQMARIHRSYAVNMDAIQSFSEHLVIVNKVELPIGRNYREDFLKQFNFS